MLVRWRYFITSLRHHPMTAKITVYCQPGAKQTQLVGWHDGKPKIQLKAPPVEGAANEALRAFVAERCGVAKSRVSIVQGQSSRTKRLAVEGLDEATLAARLRPDEPAC